MKLSKLLFSIVVFLFFINPLGAQASETESVGYSVQAILPDNQVSDVTYFDIEMLPGQQQTLEVVINNSADQDIQVEVTNNAAATNSNGVIIYDGSLDDFQVDMNYPFSEISYIQDNIVKVPANGQTTVEIQIKAPAESFDGDILGGLHFRKVNESESDESGTMITNEYVYVIGVNIVEKGNDTKVTPKLELIEVQPELINYRTGIQSTFENATPAFISRLNFTGEIYRKGEETPLYTREEEGFSVAPNTSFNFPISIDNEALQPGEYTFVATASNEDYDWSFEENFVIEKDAAEEVNKEAVEIAEPGGSQGLDNNDMNGLIYSLIATVVILVGVIVWLVKRGNAKE